MGTKFGRLGTRVYNVGGEERGSRCGGRAERDLTFWSKGVKTRNGGLIWEEEEMSQV